MFRRFNSGSDDKRKVCANCKHDYIDGDRYCRFCGAPMGKPDYIEENYACIYGPPPIERIHKCEKCGYQWTTEMMIDDERWCPICGGNAPVSSGEGIRLSLKYKGANGWKQETLCITADNGATVGRSPGCDFQVDDMCVSRKQFHILMKDNILFIENLGKTNRASINGQSFDGIRPLKSGDELQVGNVFFIAYFSCD